MSNQELPTRGQLERELSQKIYAFYREKLQQNPSKIISQILEKKIVVVIEESISNTEKILIEQGKIKLAKEVRDNLDFSLKSELQELIKEVTGVKVIDILTDATLKTARTGIIIILDSMPQIRNNK